MSYRVASWIFFAVEIVAPPLWAEAQIRDAYAVQTPPYCGLPALAIYILALLGFVLLSAIAAACAIISFRGVPVPRSDWRKLEVALMTIPPVLAAALSAWVLAF